MGDDIRAALERIRERDQASTVSRDRYGDYQLEKIGPACKSQADVAPMLAALEEVLKVCDRHATGSPGEQMVVAEVRGAINYPVIVRRTDR